VDHRLLVGVPPLRPLLRWLGNPLRSEAAAFRWLIAVFAVFLVAVVVGLVLA
jgi:hypothetical protein